MEDVLGMVKSTDTYKVLSYHHKEEEENAVSEESESDSNIQQAQDGQSSPKKRRFSHEQFHSGLRFVNFMSTDCVPC